ncbi:hypothetical protein CJP73_10735 [Neopusillimonas maritima]|uniref:Uncharacterized protein n=2 Tax=Neopusillimonas maritima TaxID=2026239 RepID=A0A3A1YSZ5_9BURK|nr:hypothetical protein CJP73_10735 [Neopusillimonas maritima]
MLLGEPKVRSRAERAFASLRIDRPAEMQRPKSNYNFEAYGVDFTDCAKTSDTVVLPGSGTPATAVVVVGLVGVIMSGEGRTGAVDLAVRDHGDSGR